MIVVILIMTGTAGIGLIDQRTSVEEQGVFVPSTSPGDPDGIRVSDTHSSIKGFDGCSWRQVVPMNRITAVRYDENRLWDDYAYLCSIPANVFYSNTSDILYSNPLIFYEPASANKVENSNQGISYFMDDWCKYLGDEIDEVVMINLSEAEKDDFLGNWPADEFGTGSEIYSDIGIYELAAEIAERDWDVSDEVVLAVIDQGLSTEDTPSSGQVNGMMPAAYRTDSFPITGTIDVGPTPPIFHNFTVDEPYRYLKAYMTWGGSAGKDPDMQLYDWNLGQVAASERWNPIHGASESAASYVYNNGEWAAAVTYMPTESVTAQRTRATNPADYNIDIDLYPGVEIELPKCPYWCRDVTVTLSWPAAGQKLGLALTGPQGEKISSSISGNNPTALSPPEMGEGVYTATVLKLDDFAGDTDFTISYSWSQKRNASYGDRVENAVQGAILASVTNSPLLYTPNGTLPAATAEAIVEMNASRIALLDIGNTSSSIIVQQLKGIIPGIEVKTYTDRPTLYGSIKAISDSSDVVISTLDPWTKWKLDKTPDTETPAGLYVGPAAFAAAHHGTPLLLTESHESLSCSKAWHNTYWLSEWSSRNPPSVGDMVLTGREIYSDLDSLGLNSSGMESILTVGGQYDIGVAWDRTMVGAAIPGRIIGNPTDTAYSICRNLFYPAMIFSNPALDPEGIEMINGSKSGRDGGDNLQIYDQGGPENYTYPILQTWVSYEHRFNERASRYWGTNYTCANGVLPFWGETNNPIDDGVNAKYGRPGMYWPDLTNSESLTFYGDKCGYESVFSTYFPRCADNLNNGVLLWLETMHGGSSGSGILGFWDGGGEQESNPWRAYETHGSTDDPDTMAMRKDTGAETHWSQGEDDRDGVIIAIQEQSHTTHVSGESFDNGLENIHSTGFLAGSCLIANTYLHLSLIRHGGVFQVIDPWVTSWYASYAYQIFMRHLALNYTVGEAYQIGMEFVGIQYLTGQWWWDILENVVYFGDPNLRVYVPKYGWDRPESLDYSKRLWLDGHTPYSHYPNALVRSVGFSRDIPDQNEDIFVNVTVFNDGSERLAGIPVHMYVDGDEKGQQIIGSVDPDRNGTASLVLNIAEWGIFTVDIIVDPGHFIDELNETDNTWTGEITVNAVPVAAVAGSGSVIFTGEELLLDASMSYDRDGTVTGYLFDFGDGTDSGWVNSSNITHSYVENGTYRIKARAMDDRGAESDFSSAYPVTVLNRKPDIFFSISPNRPLLTFEDVMLNGSGSLDHDGTVINWTWDAGDGRTLYGPNVSYHYPDDGYYTVTLSVEDNDGDIAWTDFVITVLNREPVSEFSVEPDRATGDRLTDFTFVSNSRDVDGNIKNVTWFLGDGTIRYGSNTTMHRYSDLGNYSVILRVTDDDGNMSSSMPFIISIENVLPLVDVTVDRAEALTYEVFSFNATGTDPDGVNLTFLWDIGDGDTSKKREPTHVYEDNGIYKVSCSVFDEEGSFTTATLEISVLNRPPEALFRPGSNRVRTGKSISLDAGASSDMDGKITEYRWDMGDGTVLLGREVRHTYSKESVYTVNLTVIDDDNATSFHKVEITAYDGEGSLGSLFGKENIFRGFMVGLGMIFMIVVLLAVIKKRKTGKREESRTDIAGDMDSGAGAAVPEEDTGDKEKMQKDGIPKKPERKKRKKKKRKRKKMGPAGFEKVDDTDEWEDSVDWGEDAEEEMVEVSSETGSAEDMLEDWSESEIIMDISGDEGISEDGSPAGSDTFEWDDDDDINDGNGEMWEAD